MGTERTVALPGDEILDLVPPGALAELGIALPVPVVAVRWFDPRQTCRLVHDYLEGKIEGMAAEYGCCPAYAGGKCRGTGSPGLPCLFHEPEAADAWQQAQEWERVALEPGGDTVLQRHGSGPRSR